MGSAVRLVGMVRKRLGCAGVASALVVTVFGARAEAAQVWSSDCLGAAEVKTTYNAGDQVCASGDVDVVPAGEICGAGVLHVIPRDHPNPFFDITLGGGNYFTTCLGGGGFIDQTMWLPILFPGQYEIVLDQYPFNDPQGAPFDPALDLRGVYITVSNEPVVFSCNPAEIKMAAQNSADDAKMIARIVKLIEAIQLAQKLAETALDPKADKATKAAKAAYALLCTALGEADVLPVPCPPIPFGPLGPLEWLSDWSQGKALSYLENLGKSLERMYTDIAMDPPDATFHEVVAIQMSDLPQAPWAAPGGDELSRRVAVMAQWLAIEIAAYRAFLPSFEKEQGAQAAGDHLGMLLQSEKMIAYLDLATLAGEQILAEALALDDLIAASPQWSPEVDGTEWQGSIEQAVSGGFSKEDEIFLRSLGADDVAIQQAAELLAEYADGLSLPASVGFGSLTAPLIAQHESMAAAVADLRAQAEAVRAENEPYALRLGPKASIAPPAEGVVGVAQTITASATHIDTSATLTYSWDTDLDGDFGDATGASIEVTPTASQQLVVVQVSDQSGWADVAFARIAATSAQAAPVIERFTPGVVAPFADPMEAIDFHVDATDADGDTLAITWQVDEVDAGSGADFAFVMPDEEAHTVIVRVADDDPFTPDATAGVVVRAGKWADGAGAGAGGGGGGGSGSAGGAGGAGADSGAEESGCGCVVLGDPQGDERSSWLAWSLVALVVAGRRRSRRRRAA